MSRLSIALLLLCAACAGTRHEGLAEQSGGAPIPLRYTPSSEAMPVVKSCGGVHRVLVHDARQNPASIGISFHEDSPQRRIPLTSVNVDKWIHEGADRNLVSAGVIGRDPGRPELLISVERVELEQKIAFNAEFDGTVRLEVSLLRPGSAQPCWRGLTEGFAENYGRPDNAENFSQTLNHALDRAVSKLLTTEDFEAALCGECSDAGPAAKAL